MSQSIAGVEHVVLAGRRFATVIRASARVGQSTFCSEPDSSFQLGLLAHKAGFLEPPHVHKPLTRSIEDVQQMFVVQRGVIQVEFYGDHGEPMHEVRLHAGDAIVLIAGAHAIRVLEDAQCVTVKQGPFLGGENHKIPLDGTL